MQLSLYRFYRLRGSRIRRYFKIVYFSFIDLVFFFCVLVAAEGDTVASHQGYHVQYVEPELYASQTNGGQTQMYVKKIL